MLACNKRQASPLVRLQCILFWQRSRKYCNAVKRIIWNVTTATTHWSRESGWDPSEATFCKIWTGNRQHWSKNHQIMRYKSCATTELWFAMFHHFAVCCSVEDWYSIKFSPVKMIHGTCRIHWWSKPSSQACGTVSMNCWLISNQTSCTLQRSHSAEKMLSLSALLRRMCMPLCLSACRLKPTPL